MSNTKININLCVKHTKFLTSHMPIFEYQSPCNAQKNIQPEFLLLDIVSIPHNAMFCISLVVKTFFFWGGGEAGGVGGEASPLHPPVNETLVASSKSKQEYYKLRCLSNKFNRVNKFK